MGSSGGSHRIIIWNGSYYGPANGKRLACKRRKFVLGQPSWLEGAARADHRRHEFSVMLTSANAYPLTFT